MSNPKTTGKRKALTPTQRDDLRTRLDKYINAQHRDLFPAAFKEKFGVEVGTTVNLFGNMDPVSYRVDDEPFTEAMLEFCKTWELGYVACWHVLTAFLINPPRIRRGA